MASKRERERARKKSQRAMLAAEAALVLAMRRAVAQTVASAPRLGAAALLRRAVLSVLRAAQKSTRARSNKTLKREIAAALDGEIDLADAIVEGDRKRALHVARQLAKRWKKRTAEHVAGGSPYRKAAKAAAKEVQPYLELVSRTEVAAAFNAERESVLRRTVEFTKRARGHLMLFKVWDAEMDERTCQVCDGMHGTVVRVDEDFSIPMPAHPRCRCMTSVLLLPSTFDFDEAA